MESILVVGRNDLHLKGIIRALYSDLTPIAHRKFHLADYKNNKEYTFAPIAANLTGQRFDRIITIGLESSDLPKERVLDCLRFMSTYLKPDGYTFHL